MKFENPIMNISMFEVADIITTSGPAVLTDDEKPATLYATAMKHNAEVSEILTFSFD